MQKTHNFMHRLTQGLRLVRVNTGLWALALLGLAGAAQTHATQPALRVAAASDLRGALPELQAAFAQRSGVALRTQLGSSGQLAQQIQHGLPVDVFMSADASHAQTLVHSGWARPASTVYAQGRLAWVWLESAAPKPRTTAPTGVADRIRQHAAQGQRMAIAHPGHAPYGAAAVQVLAHLGLPTQPGPHMVWGDNVSQTVQFVATGAVPAALGALALVQGAPTAVQNTLSWQAVPAQWHKPLLQTMVVARNAPTAALQWQAFMQSAPAQAILRHHGFDAPPSALE